MSFIRPKVNSNGKTGPVPVVRPEPGVHILQPTRTSCILTATADDLCLQGIP